MWKCSIFPDVLQTPDIADSQKLRPSNEQKKLNRKMEWKIVTERLGGKAGRYSISYNYFHYTAVYFINIIWLILKINK